MIRVKIFKNGSEVTGFRVSGHSGYKDAGEDIVCAAISVLAVNTINSIEVFTNDDPNIEDGDGLLDVRFNGSCSDSSKLLVDSFLLGVKGVIDEYGTEFVRLEE